MCFNATQTTGRQQEDFTLWPQLWASKLPAKYALFIWKVLHRILPVKDALFRRQIDIDARCPRCQQQGESIEHLFFHCIHSQALWRCSRLGLDFGRNTQLIFSRWWSEWMTEAPNPEDIDTTIIILWTIWVSRNKTVFENVCFSLQEAMVDLEALQQQIQRFRRQQKNSQTIDDNVLASSAPNNNVRGNHEQPCRSFTNPHYGIIGNKGTICVDGAWRARDSKGVAAWVPFILQPPINNRTEGTLHQLSAHRTRVYAQSPEFVEAKACLAALQWANTNHWTSVTIHSDCLNLVNAIIDPSSAQHQIYPMILDIISIASTAFSSCLICKTSRAAVSKAHNYAVICLRNII